MYDPIYSQNIGLCGYRCRVGACMRVVRTYRGIVMHCWKKHGLRAQMEMTYGTTEAATNDEHVRASGYAIAAVSRARQGN